MTDTRTVKAAFAQMAEWRPDNEAFVQALGGDDRRYTYAEAYDEVRRLADGLATLGLEKGDRIAILSRTSVEHAISYFACAELGAISATLHAREAPNVITSLVQHIDAAAMLFQPRFNDVVEDIRGDLGADTRFIVYDHLGAVPDFAIPYSDVIANGGVDLRVDVSPDDVAFINFSSGTTGLPKAVPHSHEDVVEASHLGGQYFLRPNATDTMLVAFTPSFIGWPNSTLPLTNVGGTLVYLEAWQPERLPSVIEREAVTIGFLVPTQWKALLQADVEQHDLGSLSLCGYAGEPMGVGLFEEIQQRITSNVVSVYGATETMTSGAALLPEEVTPENLASIGRPMPNTDLRIIEPGSHDPKAKVDRGDSGELIMRAPTVATEVWNDPETSRRIFHEDGWWFSGDLGSVGRDGNIYLDGRVDNMIISGGINIYAERVEQTLEEHEAIVECAVIPIPHDEWGQTVKAYVVTRGDITAEDLDQWCRANKDLSNYQRPRDYAFVEGLPRTNTGKLNRAEIRDRDPQQQD